MVTKVQDVQAIRTKSPDGPRTIPVRSATWEWLKGRGVKRTLFATGDAVTLVLSHVIAATAVQHWLNISREHQSPHDYWLFYLPFLLAVLYLLDRNHSPDLRRPEKELELVVKGVSFAFLLLVCANFVLFKTAGFSRYLMVTWYALALPLVLVSRFSLRHSFGALWRQGFARRRTLLVGAGGRLSEFHALLAIQRHQAYDIMGVVPAEESLMASGLEQALPVLGSLSGWEEVARESGVDQIVVCLPHTSEESHRLVSEILESCLPAGIDVQVYSDVFASRQFNYELDEFSGFFRFFAAARWSEYVQSAAKRALDFAAGAIGTLITLFVFPVVALVIWIEDPGPIFYSREFVDQDGSVRYYRKFRTMFTNAQQILDQDPALKAKFAEKHKLVDDPRITRIGRILRKYSIDELPQFLSVFRGQLSLVGPRVISRDEVGKYGENLPKLLSVKPGLTGFWQVMGRQLTTYQERIRMDMFYVDHWSIWLDLWIVAKTFVKVARAEGAF